MFLELIFVEILLFFVKFSEKIREYLQTKIYIVLELFKFLLTDIKWIYQKWFCFQTQSIFLAFSIELRLQLH